MGASELMNKVGEPPVLLFDGVCNLCNATVQFVVDRERDPCLRFAPLQSVEATTLLSDRGETDNNLNTVIFVEGDRCYRRSTAALRIARYLRWPWPLLYVFILIPPFIRDAAYSCIANRRYRWFGKSESCRIPTPELRARFLGP